MTRALSGDITLQTADGPMRTYEATPDGRARGGVIVVQEAFGVNHHIEDVTRRFADAGYHAVAPELFHRGGGGVAEYGDFDTVMKLFGSISGDADILVDIDVCIEHLRAAGIADPAIGTVGFCAGGRVTYSVALRRVIGAAVSFYGGGIVTGRIPQFPPLIDETPTLQTPWLGIFGDLDASIPVDDVETLRNVLGAAKVDSEIIRYADAKHGFHCDARDDYHADAATDAWIRTLDWFSGYLGK